MNQEEALRLLLVNRAKLLGYIRSIVRDAETAEDVFQNLSILLLKKHGQIEDEKGFMPWSLHAARLECMNAIRRKRRREISLSEEALNQLDRQWLQAERAQNSELLEALEGCLKKLTPRARRLIRLRYSDNLSGRELAETVGRKVNSIYVALSRIYQNLNRCIQQRMASTKA
ncbi:MAG: sigma-70 family RNA polymerase sigma factor [Phycisphaeraceae bacterium]|nr:sigma-70 family RNA polymerase sigma factor [Phycisphaeraceae bacterium]